MTKLAEELGVVQGAKARATSEITKVYHELQKDGLFTGINRTYSPKDDEGEQLPPEKKLPQRNIPDCIQKVEKALEGMMNTVASVDMTNCKAAADIVVDGNVLAKDVPATTLLFLDKRILEVKNMVQKLPTLDSAQQWHWDDAANAYVTMPSESIKYKKVPKTHVLFEPLVKDGVAVPGKAEMYHTDEPVGQWQTTHMSTAIPAKEKEDMMDRVVLLEQAIKKAIKRANDIETQKVKLAKPLLDYVFSGTTSQ